MSVVANPMDLTKIRARIVNGYYRQRESLLGDALTICRNTKEFERCTSSHFVNAGLLYEAIKQVVDIVWPRVGSTEEVTAADSESLVYYPNRATGPVAAPDVGETALAADGSSARADERAQTDVKPMIHT